MWMGPVRIWHTMMIFMQIAIVLTRTLAYTRIRQDVPYS